MCVCISRSVVSDSATLWAVACQAPLSMGFSRQEYWSGLPFSSPGDLPDPGIEPGSPALQEDSLPTELHGKPYDSLIILPKIVWFTLMKKIPFFPVIMNKNKKSHSHCGFP